jgi:hypothetical protein
MRTLSKTIRIILAFLFGVFMEDTGGSGTAELITDIYNEKPDGRYK